MKIEHVHDKKNIFKASVPTGKNSAFKAGAGLLSTSLIVTGITTAKLSSPYFIFTTLFKEQKRTVGSDWKLEFMKTGGAKEIVVRNDFLKLLYATMLHELPLEDVKEFWTGLPLIVRGHKLPLEDQLRHIWNDHETTSFGYVTSALNSLDPFLVSKRLLAPEFVDRLLTGLNKGAIINVSSVLKYFSPFLKFLFHTDDLRYFTLKNVMPFVLEKVIPSVYCSVVKHEKKGVDNATVMALALDKTFRLRTQPYDAGLFIARPIQVGPVRIGLPPFEEVRIISDVRPLDSVLARTEWTMKGDRFVVRGNDFGFKTTFSDFCLRHGLSCDGLKVPDARVVEMTSDYLCPVRGRPVLFKGCIYGAPLYLIRLRYQSKMKPSDNFLVPIIAESLAGSDDAWRRAEDLHSRLIADLGRRIILTYRKSDGTMFANGRRLARSAPALILRSIVKRYGETGITEFSNSDFTLDADVRESFPADNFSLRLQRLTRILEKKLPEITLAKTDRGRFELVLKSRLKFREE